MNTTKKLLRQTTWPVEKGLKVASIPVGLNTTGQKGSLDEMVVEGIRTLPSVVMKGAQSIQRLYDMNGDLDELYAREFVTKYGEQAYLGAQAGVQALSEYIGQAGTNLMERPAETLSATIIAGALTYISGRALQFHRTKGQPGLLKKTEMKLGDACYKKGE